MQRIERSWDERGEVRFICLEDLVSQDHLLRKIEKAVDFNEIYPLVEQYYCEDNGRPAADPVMLVKMVLLQHLYGIRSLRQTVKEIEVNIAYRWFLGMGIDTAVQHFATVSYAFATRFPGELCEKIFAWILEAAVAKKYVRAETVFIDGTHIKASANKNKKRKELAAATARVYNEQLWEEINADRESHEKKPLKDKPDEPPAEKETTVSTTDPDCGVFRKGENEVQFAYEAHTACDTYGFVLGYEVTPGNVHDSVAFDKVYDKVTGTFPEIRTITMDSAYRTPWICKRVFGDGRQASLPYKCPMTKDGFFKKYEYVYDEYYDCIICPNNQVLQYSTTNRDGYREYKSNPKSCVNCPHRSMCTESKNHQKVVTRHVWEDYIELADDFRYTPEGRRSYARRKETIERVFADAKEKHAMRYTHIRGLARVKRWVGLKFATMNLKKLATWAAILLDSYRLLRLFCSFYMLNPSSAT
ncbi:MAG: IS1182 family transposase [Oscillospiraceae bacterium]|nr:IS1182 family transposase [Oscillospiraceae bacterium]